MLFFHSLILPSLLTLNLMKLLSICSHFLCFPSHISNHLTVIFNYLSSHFLYKVGAMFAILVLVSPVFGRELDELITGMNK